MSTNDLIFLNPLNEYIAYLALLDEDNVKIEETTLKYEKLDGKDALVSNDSWSYALLANGELVLNGRHLAPYRWGTRMTRTGRIYIWIWYRYGPYAIVVSAFKREEGL